MYLITREYLSEKSFIEFLHAWTQVKNSLNDVLFKEIDHRKMRSPENQVYSLYPAFKNISVLGYIPFEFMIPSSKIVESIKPEKSFMGII